MARTLLLIGDAVTPRDPNSPRRDYDVLAEALNADIIDASKAGTTTGRFRGGLAIARLAAKHADEYEHIYCDSEHIGIPLAWLLAGKRERPRLTMIGHYLSPAKKRFPARLLRIKRSVSCLAVHSPLQARRARQCGLDGGQIAVVPYQVDNAYWRASGNGIPRHILSVGQEFRDYPTLIRAVDGLDVPVEIAAGSLWSSRDIEVRADQVPSNVHVGRRSYAELRQLYDESLFVVIPLHDVDFQAGIIAILEAMSMGKATVVTRTAGQTGTVSGRLLLRSGEFLDIGESSWPAETGIYVSPEDPASLRAAIDYLTVHPEQAAEMGRQARLHVEQALTIDHFVQRMTAVITGFPSTPEAMAT